MRAILLASLALAAAALAPMAQAQPARQAIARSETDRPAALARSPLETLLRTPHAPGHATLNGPYGLAVDATGKLYVANVFGNVTIYDVQHKLVGSIGSGLAFPAAVQVAYNGTIYVANNGNNTISVYDTALNQIGTMTDGTQANPTGLELAEDGSLWMLDAAGGLHEFVNGQPAGTIALGATAVGPWGSNITVWGASDGNGGYTESYQNLADALHNGAYFPSFFLQARRAGGIAEDNLGQQYITDIDNNVVVIVDTTGFNYISTFAVSAGSTGIAVDSVHHRIYVSNPSANTVTIYSASTHSVIGTIH